MRMCCVPTFDFNDATTQNRALETNRKIDRIVFGLGWGLLVILIGILALVENFGHLQGHWGRYFVLGLGLIFLIGFIVRYFGGHTSRWGAYILLIIGLFFIYVGLAFVYGVGDWWPLGLIPIGIIILLRGLWRKEN